MPRDHRVMQFIALTPRERQLLELAADGYDNYEIADALTVEVRSVSSMFGAIYDKLRIDAPARLQRKAAIKMYLTGEALHDR